MGEATGKERPILFSGSMVKALLAGTKRQTRRLINPQPALTPEVEERIRAMSPQEWRSRPFSEQVNQAWQDGFVDVACPYGQPGDRLWVRETWRTAASLDALSPASIAKKALDANYTTPWAPIQYEADGRVQNWDSLWGPGGKTRVSIHMPRWASRLTLEVTEVRVQRLQEISEEDAKAEGIGELPLQEGLPGAWWSAAPTQPELHSRTARGAFWKLWDSINGERASWDSNPWVWAVSFEVRHG